MTFEPDITDDLPLVDGVEAITLSGSSSVAVPGAKRGQLNTAQGTTAGGVSEPSEMVWLLPGANLGGAVPQLGDSISDSGGTSWTITSASYSPISQVWRIGTRKGR